MKKLALTLVTSLAAMSLHAEQNIYLTLGGGVVIPGHDSSTIADSSAVLYSPTSTLSGHSQFSLPDVIWENDYNRGFEFNIALGSTFSERMRVEGEFLYQRFNRNIGGNYGWTETDADSGTPYADTTNNLIAHAKSPVNFYATMANVYFDFKNKTPWTPFAGLGIGLGWIHSDGKTSNNNLVVDSTFPPLNLTAPAQYDSPSLHGGAFAWQGKLGLNYNYKENLSVDLTYRLLGTTTFLTGQSKIVTNANKPGLTANFLVPSDNVRGLFNNSINLSLRYLY